MSFFDFLKKKCINCHGTEWRSEYYYVCSEKCANEWDEDIAYKNAKKNIASQKAKQKGVERARKELENVSRGV
jgi:hypothetical protein